MRSFLSVWLVVGVGTGAALAQGQEWQTYGTENGEWRSYAGDIAGTKYSPLDQIDAENFSDLEIAWEWVSVDNFVSRTTPGGGEWWAPLDTIVETLVEETPELYRDSQPPNPSRLQVTPLMVDGVLYFNTPLSQGVAVDAATGETLWVFNPKGYEEGTPSMSSPWTQRGVAYWTDGEEDERIFWGTGNGHVVCVKAQTGQPCPDFGPSGSGMVDAMVGIPRVDREARDYLNALLYSINSPPIVVRDRVIHGSQIADRRITREAPPGWVRAWDVRTGEHAWDFHTVPNSPDEFGAQTWGNESWRYSGNANVWSMLAGDNELGHVYLPTGTTTNDYYGADRPGDNLYSESIIAVDVETGERVWHFQAVHHGLWDYDFPTHPNLVDVVVDGRPIKALVQISKQAFVYAFDRVTGEPIWPIEERPVPQETNMPGEAPSPTQPFPTRPEPFDYQGVTIDDLVDFTPEIRQMAIEVVSNFQIGPLFTPPGRPIEGRHPGHVDASARLRRGRLGRRGGRPRDRDALRPVAQRRRRHPPLHARPGPRRHHALHARGSGGSTVAPDPAGSVLPGADAAGPAAAQAALLAHHGHRHEHRRARLDGAPRQRRPHPQPSPPAAPEPAAAGRRHHRRAGPHQDAAYQLGGDRRTERGTRTRGVGQADR